MSATKPDIRAMTANETMMNDGLSGTVFCHKKITIIEERAMLSSPAKTVRPNVI
jgi:N-dimethylarginine dimethylaminohydrolase